MMDTNEKRHDYIYVASICVYKRQDRRKAKSGEEDNNEAKIEKGSVQESVTSNCCFIFCHTIIIKCFLLHPIIISRRRSSF